MVMDLWTLFVENIFGGFWIAVFALLFIFVIILVLGGVSGLSILMFTQTFLLAMAWGYGLSLMSVLIFLVIGLWVGAQFIKFSNET
ncbi:MAG: hypothetical protein ACP5D2_03840 [Candidatus Nanoarchaeia archaeon]